ncbi:MAG: exodeoxyribonuclease III [Acidobacteriota bacterium]
MRIVSWNVNGIRAAAKKGFGEWLAGCGADVVGLQETRARLEQFPEELRQPEGWSLEIHAAQRGGYSGVAVYSSDRASARLESVERSLGEERFDVEGRLIDVRYGALRVVNGYFPNGNGKNRDLSRIPYKLDFYRAVFDRLESARAAGDAILVMGDLNTAHREIDLARPKQNVRTSGFRPEEREELDRWLHSGWTDTFRHVNGDQATERYSWWSQRKGVREKNIGWRIDYILASPGAMEHLRGAEIHPEVLGSDHCPISVELDPAVLG